MQHITIKKTLSGLALSCLLALSLVASPVAAQSGDSTASFLSTAPQSSSSTTATTAATTTTTATSAASTTATSGATLTLPKELPVTGSFDVVLTTILGAVFVSAGVAAAKTLFTTYE